MSKFTDEQTDKMLRTYHSHKQEVYKFSRQRKLHLTSAIAACIAILIIAGICFIPTGNSNPGFSIVANALTLDEEGIASADELNNETFVEIKSVSYPIVDFNFDCILNENAEDFNLTQKYLFQTIFMNLHLDVVGDNIETVTYKTNKGAFNVSYFYPEQKDSRYKAFITGYDHSTTEYTFDYEKRDQYQFTFTPVYDDSVNVERVTKYYSYLNDTDSAEDRFSNPDNLVFSEDSGALNAEYGWVSSIASGYKGISTLAVTQEELNTLKSYAKADDMVGFFNYQNDIFKRIIDDTVIDITVTRENGSKETKSVELCYTPDVITSTEGYLKDQTRTFSTGTISAKIK